MTLAYADIPQGGSDVLTVASELPEQVAGVQLELNYDPTAITMGCPRLTEFNDGYILQSSDDGQGRMVLLLYNMQPF